MKYKLRDLITIKHGFAFSGDHITNVDNGIVLVTPGNFKIGGGFKEEKCKFFDGQYPIEFVLKAGDLIVTMTDLSKTIDTLGYSAILPQSDKIYLHNQRIGLVKNISDALDKNYLYWFMRSPKYQKQIAATSSGSTVHHTSPDRIRDIEIDLPDISTQKRIVSILSALDDKIELNERINKIFEEQAQALFKAWFVDYEPFGGTFPSTWRRGLLSELASITSGKRPPMRSPNKTDLARFPIVGAASVMGFTTEANHTDKILVTGRVGTHGVIQRFNCPCWTSDNTLVITSDYYEYVYQILQCIDYQAMNRGSTQPLITQSDMNKVEVLIPDQDALDRFEKIAGRIMSLHEINGVENQKLAAIRDLLLEKIMINDFVI